MADKFLNLSNLQYLWNKILSEISSSDDVDIYKYNETAYSDITRTINNNKLKAVLMSSNVYPVIRIRRDTNYIVLYTIQYSENDGYYYIVGLRINSSDTWVIVSVEAIALKNDIPDSTSDLTNDSGYITSQDLPTKTSDLTNDSGFITNAVNNLTNYTDTSSMNSLLDDKVSKTGDTMSGQLNIRGNAASKPLRVRNVVGSDGTSTDGPLYLNYGNANVIALGSTGAYNISADGSNYSGNSNTATKLENARTIRTNLASTSTASFDGSSDITPGVTGTLGAGHGGTGQTSLKDSANALVNALDTAIGTPIDSMYVVTAGNTSSLLNTFYRRPISALKTYIAEQLTGTSMVTTTSTMAANVTPAHKYDNHGAIEKYGRVCTLDLNCDYSASYNTPTKIGTIPTGYRPRVKHSYNIQTNSGTSNPYITINTNGDVQLGGYTGGIGFRAVLTWIAAI